MPFVAFRGGVPVGRIAAVVNHAHNEYYKDKTGFFGFFDFIDDIEVASALLGKAKQEITSRGFTSMRGPYNPTINDECGVLTEGFSSSPFVMMTYNSPYYLGIYEKLGLQKARDLAAYYISGAAVPPERIQKIVNRVKKSTGVVLRELQLKRLDEELKIIHVLYNETLKRNWGFVPITLEDLQFAAADLKAIVDPSMVVIAEKDGVPMGFSMCIPNINELMWKAKSSKGLMRILKFVWYMKTRRPKEARLTVLGVLPEFRNKGIGVLFYHQALVVGGKRYIGGELSWVDEDNDEMTKAVTLMGARKYKSYRIFETALA